MKKYYLIPFAILVAAFAGFCLIFVRFQLIQPYCLVDVYEKKLQVPLFSGFLTISGFLLSLTIFIVVKMHEAVYQDTNYRERVEQIKDIHPNYDGTAPLQNLTTFLLVSVVFALLTSFSQFTIGNWQNFYIVAFCLSLAVAASSIVLLSCFVIRSNIQFWISYINAKPKPPSGGEVKAEN